MPQLKTIRINTPHVIHEIIDGEAVLVNLESGNYYSMDHVGAFIWNLIEQQAQFDQVFSAVANQYSGSTEEIESGITQLFDQLEAEKLIVAAESTNGDSPFQETSSEGEKLTFELPVLHKYTDMVDLLLLDPIHEVDDTGWPNLTDQQS